MAAALGFLQVLDGEQPHPVDVLPEQVQRRLEELDRLEAPAPAA